MNFPSVFSSSKVKSAEQSPRPPQANQISSSNPYSKRSSSLTQSLKSENFGKPEEAKFYPDENQRDTIQNGYNDYIPEIYPPVNVLLQKSHDLDEAFNSQAALLRESGGSPISRLKTEKQRDNESALRVKSEGNPKVRSEEIRNFVGQSLNTVNKDDEYGMDKSNNQDSNFLKSKLKNQKIDQQLVHNTQRSNKHINQSSSSQQRFKKVKRLTYLARRPSYLKKVEAEDEVANSHDAVAIKQLNTKNVLSQPRRKSTYKGSIDSSINPLNSQHSQQTLKEKLQFQSGSVQQSLQSPGGNMFEKAASGKKELNSGMKSIASGSEQELSSSESSFESNQIEEIPEEMNQQKDESLEESEIDHLIEDDEEVTFEDTIINQIIHQTKDSGGFAKAWSIFVFLTNTYNFITVWYFLGLQGFPSGIWLFFELMTEAIFIADLFIKVYIMLRLPSHWSKMWLLQYKYQTIGTIGWLCLILATIPQSFILSLIFKDDAAKLGTMLIASSRLLKLLRFNEVHKYFDTKVTEQVSFSQNLRITQAMYVLLLSTHVIGCSWLIVARVEADEPSWFDMARYRGPLAANNLRPVTDFEKYIDALFFVVSTMNGMGYGNILPTTNLEWIVDILIMIAGCSTWGGFFADFTVELYKQNQATIDNEEKLDQAMQFALQRGLPSEMRDRIRLYYNNVRLNFKVLEDKYEILNQLPLTLKSELSLLFNCELIQKVKFFQLSEPSFILRMSRCMQPLICLHEDFVVKGGTLALHMFFIQIGIVQILATDNKTVIAYQSQGCYFGEIGVLLSRKRSCSVKAMTMCTFMAIQKQDLLKILEDYPSMGKFLRAVGRQRLQTTTSDDLSGFEKNVFECGDGENIVLQESDFDTGGQKYRNDLRQSSTTVKKEPSIVINEDDSEKDSKTEKSSVQQNSFQKGELDISSNSKLFGSENKLIPSKQKSIICPRSFLKGLSRLLECRINPIYLTDDYLDVEGFVIIPFSVLFNVWMTIIVLVTIYFVLDVPMEIVLTTSFLDNYGQAFQALEIVCTIIFCIDVFLRSRLAYSKNSRDESMIQINLRTSQEYYIDNFLIYDLFAAAPIHFILLPFGFNSYFVFSLRILKLLKIVRIMELIEIVKRHSDISKNLIKFALYFTVMCVSAHIIACVFVFIGQIEVERKSRFDGQTMFGDVINRNFITPSPEITDRNFFFFKPVQESTSLEKYIHFLYLASLTMGTTMYGDLIPFAMSEQLFDIVAMIFARAFLALFFGQAASYLTSIQTSVSRHSSKVNNVTKWIEKNQFPKSLKLRILRYYNVLWLNFKGVVQQEIMQDLPVTLSNNVRSFLFKNIVKNWDIILSSTQQDKGVVSSIIQNLELRIIPAGEFIIRYGETAQHMFFIIKGTVSVISQEGIILAQLGPGKNLGEMALLKEGDVRSASIIADTDVSVAVMSTTDFKRICDMYSAFKLIIMQVVLKRVLENKATLIKAVELAEKRESQINQNQLQFNGEKLKLGDINREQVQSQIEMVPQTPMFKSQKLGNQQSKISDNARLSSRRSRHEQKQSRKSNSKSSSIDQNQSKRSSKSKSSKVHISPDRSRPQSPASVHSSILGNLPQPEKSPRLSEKNSKIQKNDQKFSVSTMANPQCTVTLRAEGIKSHFAQWEQDNKTNQDLKQRIMRALTKRNFMMYSMIAISFYNLIFIPLQFAYRIPFKGIYLVLEFATILLYLLDIFMRFKNIQSLVNAGGNLPDSTNPIEQTMMEDKDQFKNRIRSIQVEIICSLIACIPFSLLFWVFEVHDPIIIIDIVCSVRLVKILPLKKMFDMLLSKNMEKWRIIQVVVYYHLINHYIACCWISIAYFVPDVRSTWLRRAPVPQPLGMRPENNLDGLSDFSIYLHASFFVANTISHIGVGAISPVNFQEKIFVVFLIPIGIFVYAFLFGNIVSIVSELGVNQQITYYEKYKYVMKKIETLNLGKQAKAAINEYFNYIWGNDLDIYEEELLQDLPMTMKTDLLFCKYQEAIENSLIFKDDTGAIDLALTNSVINFVDVRLYMTGEFIIQAGSINKKTYIILEGAAALVSGCENEDMMIDSMFMEGTNIEPDVIGVMRPGCHFSNDLPNSQFNYHNRRICHLVALQPCLVGVIPFEKLNVLYVSFPKWKQKMQAINLFTFQKCEGYFSTYRSDIQDYLKTRMQKPLINQDNLSLQDLALQFLVHQITFFKEESYQWIRGRLSKFKKLKVQEEENLVIKQKIFFYGQEGMVFPFFDNQYIEIHKKKTQMNNLQQILDRVESSMDRAAQMEKREQRESYMTKLQQVWSQTYIHVKSKARKAFEVIQIINLLFIIIATPFVIGFEINSNEYVIAEVLSLFLSVFWIFVNFRTQLIIKGSHTLNFSIILHNYQNNGLWLDILGVIPFNLIFKNESGSKQAIIVQSLLRLVRLPSSWRAIHLLRDLEISFKGNKSSLFFQTIKAIFCIFIQAHLVACLFFYISIQTEQDPSVPLWIDYNNVRYKQVKEQYLRTLYMVYNIVCTVGSGDMFPMTDLERIFYIGMVTVGDVFFNLAFGLITNITIMITLGDDTNQFKGKMLQIQDFLKSFNLDQVQQKRVQQYFAYEFKQRNNPNLINHVALEGYLPHGLRAEVKFQASRDMLFKMFAEVNSENFLRRISVHLKPVIFLPGDFMMSKGEIGDSMFFIAEGRAWILFDDKQTIVSILESGDYFGEHALFAHSLRPQNVQAGVFCIVNELKREDFNQVVKHFPEIQERLRVQAEKTLAALNQLQDSENDENMRYSLLSPENSKQLNTEKSDSPMHNIKLLLKGQNNLVNKNSQMFSVEGEKKDIVASVRGLDLKNGQEEETIDQNQPDLFSSKKICKDLLMVPNIIQEEDENLQSHSSRNIINIDDSKSKISSDKREIDEEVKNCIQESIISKENNTLTLVAQNDEKMSNQLIVKFSPISKKSDSNLCKKEQQINLEQSPLVKNGQFNTNREEHIPESSHSVLQEIEYPQIPEPDIPKRQLSNSRKGRISRTFTFEQIEQTDTQPEERMDFERNCSAKNTRQRLNNQEQNNLVLNQEIQNFEDDNNFLDGFFSPATRKERSQGNLQDFKALVNFAIQQDEKNKSPKNVTKSTERRFTNTNERRNSRISTVTKNNSYTRLPLERQVTPTSPQANHTDTNQDSSHPLNLNHINKNGIKNSSRQSENRNEFLRRQEEQIQMENNQSRMNLTTKLNSSSFQKKQFKNVPLKKKAPQIPGQVDTNHKRLLGLDKSKKIDPNHLNLSFNQKQPQFRHQTSLQKVASSFQSHSFNHSLRRTQTSRAGNIEGSEKKRSIKSSPEKKAQQNISLRLAGPGTSIEDSRLQRRLSRICLGKSLTLSQTLELKMQWTVGN